jgi:hypothetical protein
MAVGAATSEVRWIETREGSRCEECQPFGLKLRSIEVITAGQEPFDLKIGKKLE